MGSAEESAKGSSNASTSSRQELDSVRSDHELVVVGPVTLGDEARAVELVERFLLESDRERTHRSRALLRGERGQRGRVDPA